MTFVVAPGPGRAATARCGTPSGYNAHRDREERPCQACYDAKSAYDRRRRAAPEQVRSTRLAARAQQRAQTRMRHAHPEEYARYYAEEKAALEREAFDEERSDRA